MEKNKVNLALRCLIAVAILITALAACGKKNGSNDYDSANGNLPDLEHQGELIAEREIPADTLADSLSALKKQTTEPSYSNAAYDSIKLKEHRYTWTDSKDIPPVIIIVDDFGMADGDLLQGFADLPKEVAFAILPDLPKTKKSANLAVQTGHDVIIHVPMEAKMAKISPGVRHLKTTQDEKTITDMLDAFYEQLPMAIGANNHMGSSATNDKYLMSVVLNHLNSRGLFFIDSGTIGNSVAYKLAATLGFKSIKRDLFLDVPDNTDATIAARISDLGRYKGRKEPVIIITHCHNKAKLHALQKFIAQITAMGVRLTSLSQAYLGGVAMQ